jgi:hypothetical protein
MILVKVYYKIKDFTISNLIKFHDGIYEKTCVKN